MSQSREKLVTDERTDGRMNGQRLIYRTSRWSKKRQIVKQFFLSWEQMYFGYRKTFIILFTYSQTRREAGIHQYNDVIWCRPLWLDYTITRSNESKSSHWQSFQRSIIWPFLLRLMCADLDSKTETKFVSCRIMIQLSVLLPTILINSSWNEQTNMMLHTVFFSLLVHVTFMRHFGTISMYYWCQTSESYKVVRGKQWWNNGIYTSNK